MDRLSNYYRSLLLFLVFAFFSAGAKAQDCEIQLTAGQKTEGCAPFQFGATVVNKNTSKTVSTITWDFGDNTGANTALVNHFYSSRGTFCLSAKIKYSDGTECTASLPNGACIKVFGKPKADMILPSGGLSVQCYQKNGTINKFCFTHKSTRSADGAAITGFRWNFGDGETSTDENPCHSYDSSGQYNITLEVTDANGCTDRQEMKASIIVLP
ncbi:MAG: PKD domain-containing protein, partial [Bacteroidia bacterium]